MATTIVPDPKPLKKDINLQDLLEEVHENLIEATGDSDKADEVPNAAYYDGMADAYKHVEDMLTE